MTRERSSSDVALELNKPGRYIWEVSATRAGVPSASAVSKSAAFEIRAKPLPIEVLDPESNHLDAKAPEDFEVVLRWLPVAGRPPSQFPVT